MEKTRVPKGEWYYYVDISHGVEPTPMNRKEMDEREDSSNFYCNNYFRSWIEAESMARKLRAVLKGAEVIEMPSEEDIENAMKTSVTESILCVAPYESFTPKATDLLECAWLKGAEFLKSKIVK